MTESHTPGDARARHADDGEACQGCAVLATRRAFLRDSLGAVAAVAASLGLARSAFALPVRLVASSGVRGQTASYPVPVADGVEIDHDQQVILVRWEHALYAFALACPHQNTALHWVEHDSRFQCPRHKSRYQPDGTFISGRATRSMDRFALRQDGENVVVDLEHLYRQDENPAEWASAVIHLA